VFAVFGRSDDLISVELVWGAHDYGVDGVVPQHGVEVRAHIIQVWPHRITGVGVDVDTHDDLHMLASRQVSHDLTAPPPKAHDSCVDHDTSQGWASTQRIVAQRELRAHASRNPSAAACPPTPLGLKQIDELRECLPRIGEVQLTT
jgi:hypothetical protein